MSKSSAEYWGIADERFKNLHKILLALMVLGTGLIVLVDVLLFPYILIKFGYQHTN